eukprot:CAMPEP_0117422862 /NCGR_PEP_ID=MMETSP0758-20121206/3613_1 /TAXON_ID=63605 /ORGANISM="Percolomonas cosmopolitus, Strain AE-1 (ATCC 50343)" /LENGTH=441 /DNA_ID=CAMNT_0005205729 /DNA_START=475 /DNA_END=1797 /DNA_ORIENTATION=+
MEIIYSHIVQKPDGMEYVPTCIEQVIMKMLEKAPEDRYKSCQGIISDLKKCKELLEASRFEEKIILGTNDHSGKLAFSNKLYGREEEEREIKEALETLEDTSTLVTLTGAVGTGKTEIIDKLHGEAVETKGFFITGKFEQTKSKEPYTAFQMAFSDMVEQIFVEEEETIKEWKELIRETLLDRAKVLCDFMPAFTTLVDQTTKIEELQGKNAFDRFNIVFTEFLKSFTSPENPLVIALDDAQFADSASLELIKLVCCKNPVPGLAIILSYKEASEDIQELINEAKKASVRQSTITLKSLKEEHIQQLLGDLLGTKEGIKELAAVIMEKTAGTPFFVRATITKLYEEKLLKWNKMTTKWDWDIIAIKDITMANNVVELLTEKIQQLEPIVIKVLKVCSVIGSNFNGKMIGALISDPHDIIVEALLAAKNFDLIVPIVKLDMD